MKDIKDYLHLYLGCDVEADSLSDNTKRFVYKLTPSRLRSILEYNNYDNSKPILRNLSDMTKDEIIHFFLLKGLDYSKVTNRTSIMDNFIQIEYKCAGELLSDYQVATFLNPEQTKYLLEKHFDLFGLINDGLAIDKTTIA